MRRKNVFFIAACLVFVLTACGGTEEPQESSTAWQAEGSVVQGEVQEKVPPVEIKEIWPETDVLSETKEWTYNEKTDLYPHQRCSWYVDSEDRVYDISDQPVRFFDKKTCTWSVLCNRPDCSHGPEEECFGCFQSPTGTGGQYYGGKLYTVEQTMSIDDERGREYTYSLYVTDPAAMTREWVQTFVTVLQQKGERRSSQLQFLIHRGYVYYWYTSANSSDPYANGGRHIYRVPLGGTAKEAECVYKIKQGEFIYLKPYGDNIYFCDTEEEGAIAGNVYRINTAEKQVEKLPLGDTVFSFEFFVLGDTLYYDGPQEDGKIKTFSLTDGTTKVVFDFTGETGKQLGGLDYDGTFWYAAVRDGNGYDRVVFDQEFNLLGTIENPDPDRTLETILDLRNFVLIKYPDGKMGWVDKEKMTQGDFTICREE